MKHIKLGLPKKLLKKVEEFEPEALEEVRRICANNGIDEEISAIIERDMAAFLRGIRSEHAEDIGRVTALLSNEKIIAEIQRSAKYYIVAMFRHYCDIAMKWEVFGEMFPMATGDGRTFFRDWCAVAILYFNATKYELTKIDTGDIDFQTQPYKYVAYKESGREPVSTGKFELLDKKECLKGAYCKAREWRKMKPDTDLSKTAKYLTIWKSISDTFAIAPTIARAGEKMTLKKAIANYNENANVRVSETYIYDLITGFASCDIDKLKLTRTDEYLVNNDYTLGDICRFLTGHTTFSKDQLLGYTAALRFLSQCRTIVLGAGVYRRGRKNPTYKTIMMPIDIRLIDLPTMPANNNDIKLSFKSGIYIHRIFMDGLKGQSKKTNIDGKELSLPLKDSKYLLPANSFKASHRKEFWDRFVMQIKGKPHKSEADLINAVYDYTNKETLVRQEITFIQKDEKLSEEKKNESITKKKKEIHDIQKDKLRKTSSLGTLFEDAKKIGIIVDYGQRKMNSGKIEYWWEKPKEEKK